MTIQTVIDMRPQPAAEVAEPHGFDYSQIDEGIRDEVKAAARSIHQLGAGVVTGIIAIGKRLIEVKGMLPHGQFIEWVLGEFGVTERTAQNYMNVAREYGDPQKRNTISLFSPTVAYLLAAPSTPEEARAEVEQAAAGGQRVTVEFAKEAIRKAKPEPVQYAPVWALEAEVKVWLKRQQEHGADEGLILDHLAAWSGVNQDGQPGSWRHELQQWLAAASYHYRTTDLKQAINNVRDQRRQAKAQASARAVYVEPKAEPDNSNPFAPRVTKVEVIDGVTVKHMQFSAVLPPTPPADADPAPTTPAPTIPDDLTAAGYRLVQINPKMWAIERDEESEKYQSSWVYVFDIGLAVKEARRHLARRTEEAAAAAEVEAERAQEEAERLADGQPDPRLAQARTLREWLGFTRDLAHAHYGDLTGRATDLLEFDRDVAKMLPALDSLIAILEGRGHA